MNFNPTSGTKLLPHPSNTKLAAAVEEPAESPAAVAAVVAAAEEEVAAAVAKDTEAELVDVEAPAAAEIAAIALTAEPATSGARTGEADVAGEAAAADFSIQTPPTTHPARDPPTGSRLEVNVAAKRAAANRKKAALRGSLMLT